MEGTPADLRVYKDANIENDHTFIGNGCDNWWGTDGDGGSITPCSSRLIETADGETQLIGVYYHFQAATVGTGGAMQTENTNSPDTFCPLGWQLPYSGTGGDYYDQSKSWAYLLTRYNIPSSGVQNVAKVKSYPFSYIASGYFPWSYGRLYYLTNGGLYWYSNQGQYPTHGDDYEFWTSSITINKAFHKTNGIAVRCVTY